MMLIMGNELTILIVLYFNFRENQTDGMIMIKR